MRDFFHIQSMRRSTTAIVIIIVIIIIVGASIAFAFATTTTETFTKTPETQMAASLARGADVFVQHMRVHHSSDPRTARLLSTWQGVFVDTDDFPSTTIRGSFSKETGELKVRVDDPGLSDAQLRGVLLHELAHTNGQDHDVPWRDAFIWFCDIATRELGWDVALSQPHNCRNYGICDVAWCPSCAFETQKTHEVTRGTAARVHDSIVDVPTIAPTLVDPLF